LAMMAFSLGGCGTAGNTIWLFPEEGGMRVYGGVKGDIETLQHPEHNSHTTWVDPAAERRREVLLSLLDLPFSAAGDTLTLPFTLYAAMTNPEVELWAIRDVKDENERERRIQEWKLKYPGYFERRKKRWRNEDLERLMQ